MTASPPDDLFARQARIEDRLLDHLAAAWHAPAGLKVREFIELAEDLNRLGAYKVLHDARFVEAMPLVLAVSALLMRMQTIAAAGVDSKADEIRAVLRDTIHASDPKASSTATRDASHPPAATATPSSSQQPGGSCCHCCCRPPQPGGA